MVNAASYDDQQYARKVRADDDQWAEDYDRYTEKDFDRRQVAASEVKETPGVVKTAYVPSVDYGYGVVNSYGGYGAGLGYGSGLGYGGIGGYGYGAYAAPVVSKTTVVEKAAPVKSAW